MGRIDAKVTALRKEFIRARARNPERQTFPVFLRRKAARCLKEGAPLSDVIEATGIDEVMLSSWVNRYQGSSKPTKKANVPEFRSLEIVSPARPLTVSLFVDDSIRLEFPAELLSRDLISRLREAG